MGYGKPSAAQAELAKSVRNYLLAHIRQHITTEELAEHFGVSATHIKNSFANTFGISVQAYARQQKMDAAAELLQSTRRTVLDIAGQFGYANGSKFAAAFRRVKGMSPREYRRTPAEKEKIAALLSKRSG